MGDIVNLVGGRIEVEVDPDEILEQLKGRLQAFVMYGYDVDGNEMSVVTFPHLPEALWITERGKKHLLEKVDYDEH